MHYDLCDLRHYGSPELLVLLISFGLASPGCSEEPGPEHFPTTQIAGTLVEGGRPVSGGWIEFIPTDGTVGNIRSAVIGKDGKFQVDRAPIGENAIRLVNAPITIPGGARLFGQFATPIRRKIPARPDGPLNIDLLEEAVRYQASLPRRTAHAGTSATAKGADQ
jgi:hypothetical protein